MSSILILAIENLLRFDLLEKHCQKFQFDCVYKIKDYFILKNKFQAALIFFNTNIIYKTNVSKVTTFRLLARHLVSTMIRKKVIKEDQHGSLNGILQKPLTDFQLKT